MNKLKLCCIFVLLLLCVFQTSTLYEGIDDDEDVNMPTGSMPTGSMPTGSMPTGSMPTGSMPTGSMPTGSMPTGSMATDNKGIDSLTKIETFQDYRIIPSDMCNDSTSWYALDRGNKKYYCEDVGKTASCYDYGVDGRDAWEACKNKCGNCMNTQVSNAPMDVMATFSGDPIEDFGVVLGIDKDRDWVGKDDARDFTDDAMADDIATIYDQLEDIQDFTNLIMGNVKQCKLGNLKCNKGDQFQGCNECFKCPSPGLPTPTKPNTYIKQTCEGAENDNCSIQFPAVDISCDSVDTILSSSELIGNYKLDYVGCFKDNDGDSDRIMKGLGEGIKCNNKVSNCHELQSKTELDKKNECAKKCLENDGCQYMGIQFGNQCFCSKKKPDDSKEEEKGINHCGLGGKKCFEEQSGGEHCDNHNSVYHIVDAPPVINRVEECNQYYLFDKIGDDKQIIKPTNKKMTLTDMCPKQCDACK
jgi:hypothetical protein